ncbi:hypothetical protein D3C79_1067860 [compost metagenome]
MDAFKRLVAEASNRSTPPNRVQEIREELKRLRQARRVVTEGNDKESDKEAKRDSKKQLKTNNTVVIEGDIIKHYNDAYYKT